MAVTEAVLLLPNPLTNIEYSVSPRSTVCHRLEGEEWTRHVLRVLTPTGYTAVITAAAINFDHPHVAALVSSEMGEYTHECVVAAL